MLGYGSTRRGRVHPVQRWRCDIAVRSRDPERSSVVVFTGGGSSRVTEAEAMATHARESLGVSGEDIRLEDTSRNTRENLTFALPMVGDAEVIKIISDPLHAARGRSYVRELRPDLAVRLVPADDYRFLERWWIKAAGVAYALRRTTRDAIRPRRRYAGRVEEDEAASAEF